MIKNFETYINEDYFSKLASRKDNNNTRKENESNIEYIMGKHRPTITKIFCDFLMKFGLSAAIECVEYDKAYNCEIKHTHDNLEWLLCELINNDVKPNVVIYSISGETQIEYEDFAQLSNNLSNIVNKGENTFIEYRFDYYKDTTDTEPIYNLVIFENLGYNTKKYAYVFDNKLGSDIQKRRNNMWKSQK